MKRYLRRYAVLLRYMRFAVCWRIVGIGLAIIPADVRKAYWRAIIAEGTRRIREAGEGPKAVEEKQP
jgi:hypothetical protein